MSVSETVPDSAADEKKRLRRSALSLGRIVASTLAVIAPAMSFFFGFSGIVKGAGLAAVLTILTAMIVILFLTNTVAQFSRFAPSAGSFVTFTGKAFGPSVGATVAVFTNFGYIILASALVAIAGAWVAETLKTFLAISLPSAAITVLTSLAIGWLVTRGVELSAFWAGVFFYFEGGLLVLGAVTMLGTHTNFLTPAPFLFSNLAGGLAGLGAGFPLAVFLFIGWESSAPLAEETETPRRNIPRALIASTLSIGLLYVFLAYATAVGLNMDAHLLGASQIPFIDALRASAPTLLIVAYLAGITSIVSALIAGTNSFPRVLFNCGREGLLPKFLGKIHSRHRTPYVAIWASLVIAVIITLGFGLLGGVAPLDYFGFAGTLGTIPVILTYMLTNLALPVYVLRYRRADFDTARHLLLPIIGTAVMLFPLWGLVQPGQSWPFNLFPWIALGVLALSGIYGAILARSSPDLTNRIGAYVADQQ